MQTFKKNEYILIKNVFLRNDKNNNYKKQTMIELNEIKLNKDNPRKINDKSLKKLIDSIKSFPRMLELRPIVVDTDNVIIGGNMRFRALQKLGYKTIPNEWIKVADNLTEAERKHFIIEDNVNFGEWDDNLLKNWNIDDLKRWGLNIEKSQTEKNSTLDYTSIYYEPKEFKDLSLKDCFDFEKYEKKKKIIESSECSEEIKRLMILAAQRFIKIDYELVANYYTYNATDEEKKIIERLRLVLVDGGLNGFIEDDLLHIVDCLNYENGNRKE